jgi:hypothetical protein
MVKIVIGGIYLLKVEVPPEIMLEYANNNFQDLFPTLFKTIIKWLSNIYMWTPLP